MSTLVDISLNFHNKGSSYPFSLSIPCKSSIHYGQILKSNYPQNIFNFGIKYINNSMPTRKNLHLWSLSATSDCSFHLQSESLLRAADCKAYLDQGCYARQHNSALIFITQTLQSIKSAKLYVDLPGYLSPCSITREKFRADSRQYALYHRIHCGLLNKF